MALANPKPPASPATKSTRSKANAAKGRALPAAPEAVGRADPTTDPAGYEVDFYLWAYTQADLLRSGRYTQLDLPNLIEELETLGRSDKHKLFSHYRLLMHHLLKWQFQPERRSSSWRLTIVNARYEIEFIENDSGTLKRLAEGSIGDIYRKARRAAADETGLDIAVFPAECPYSMDMLRDADALPDRAHP